MSRNFTLAALLVLASAPALANESAYTPTSGAGCRQMDDHSELASWECRGPKGYTIGLSDAGVSVGVDFWRGGAEKPGSGVSWPGRFGKLIEVRLSNGAPTAAILRIWRFSKDRNGEMDTSSEKNAREELLVLKVSARGACRVGQIAARQPRANEAARKMADGVTATTPCAGDEF